jgi:thiamine-monophosphate kinase
LEKVTLFFMNKESFFINLFQNKFIGDDGALIGNTVYSMDAFFENVHFKREWMSLEQIAAKSMLVNISDAIAMNAIPKYALLSVAIPKHFSKDDLRALWRGFDRIAKMYSCEIIGGDTIANSKLDISVTIVSTTSNPLLRSGIKEGDLIAYTGTLGLVKKDLNRLFRGAWLPDNSRFIEPKLRQDFIYKSSKYLRSAMDISDGLYTDLSRLSKFNTIGFDFLHPISKAIGCSGEEYEMLIAFSAKNRARVESLAKQTKTPLTIFAIAKRGKFTDRCKSHHF